MAVVRGARRSTAAAGRAGVRQGAHQAQISPWIAQTFQRGVRSVSTSPLYPITIEITTGGAHLPARHELDGRGRDRVGLERQLVGDAGEHRLRAEPGFAHIV